MLKVKKELEKKILVWTSAVIITFLIFSASLFLVLVDRGFYDKSFQQYGAYDKIGIDGIRTTADSIINYLLGDNGNPNTAGGFTVFTTKEKSHMQDVHSIFKTVKYLSIVMLGLLVIIFLRMRANGTAIHDIPKSAKYAGIKILIALATVFLLSSNFDWFFTAFHQAFFPQGNWQFPIDSILIIMFPQAFFEDYMKRMFLHILVSGVLLVTIGSIAQAHFRDQRIKKEREEEQTAHRDKKHPKKKPAQKSE